jgi:hypothetical protein
MLDIALSRSELAVCMTRFAMRPAKSFWTKRPALPHDMPVTLPPDQAGGARYQCVVPDRHVEEYRERPHDEHESDHAEQHRHRGLERRRPIRRFHQRHEPRYEQRYHGIEQRNGEARREHRRVPTFGLPDEVPIERDQTLGGRTEGRTFRHGNVEVDELHGSVPRDRRGTPAAGR